MISHIYLWVLHVPSSVDRTAAVALCTAVQRFLYTVRQQRGKAGFLRTPPGYSAIVVHKTELISEDGRRKQGDVIRGGRCWKLHRLDMSSRPIPPNETKPLVCLVDVKGMDVNISGVQIFLAQYEEEKYLISLDNKVHKNILEKKFT